MDPIDGERVESPEAIRKRVAFQVLEPRNLGAPSAIFESTGDPAERRSLAFVYDTPEYGIVDVLERLPENPPGVYEDEQRDFLRYNGQPFTHGRADLVMIRRDQHGLVTTSEDGGRSSISWLEGDAEIIVEGPDLSFEDVVTIANEI